MREVLTESYTVFVDDGGVVFDSDWVVVWVIAATGSRRSLGVTLGADLAGANAHVQAGIAFGEANILGPTGIEHTTIQGFSCAVTQVGSKESVVAEKIQAIVSLGLVDSRLNDFCDVQDLAQVTEFRGSRWCESLSVTFLRRKTALRLL